MTGEGHQTKKAAVTVYSMVVLFNCALTIANAADINSMTLEQARQRVPDREIPNFWVGDVGGLDARFEKLTVGRAETIARSPGGRPIHLVTYGRKEKVEYKANFNSAIGAREPQAYMNKAARKKPVVLFVGPVHGAEVEALTGLINFINVMETGKDLRGRNQRKLRA
ncbi:MAG: hypothetical protein ACYSU4_14125, partial [Planctomycetota bacterium]